MRETIDTVPRDGEFVILEDDASGTYDVARWSADAATWIGEDGAPSPITPTHWHPLSQEHHRQSGLEDIGSRDPATAGQASSWLRRHVFARFAAWRAAPRPPVTTSGAKAAPGTVAAMLRDIKRVGDTVKTAAPTRVTTAAPPVAPDGINGARRRGKLAPIAASLVAVALAGLWFYRSEFTGPRETSIASATRGDEDIAQIKQALQQERDRTQALTRGLAMAQRELEMRATLSRKASDEAAQFQQAAERAATELRQALQQERDKAETLAADLATARREIETQTARAAKAADDVAQLRQAAERTMAELQQARDQSEALTRDLAAARRQVETQAVASTKAGGEAAEVRESAERLAAAMQQAVQQERDRADALARDLATARREIETQAVAVAKAGSEAAEVKESTERQAAAMRQAVQQERDRAEALARDLATARRELETQAAAVTTAGGETAQVRDAAVRATQELQRAQQQERERAEALTRDLATARREIEAQVAASSKAGDDAARLQQAAERAAAELRQTLGQERERAEALTRDLAAARREIETQVATATQAGDRQAQARQLSELRQALQQAQARAETLAQEVEAARHAMAVRVAQERDSASQIDQQIAQVKQTAEAAAAAYRESLAQERARTQALEQQLAARRDATPGPGATASLADTAESTTAARPANDKPVAAAALPRDQPATPPAAGVARQVPVAAPTGALPVAPASDRTAMAPPAAGDPEAVRLVARAGILLSQGNIGAARIVLERAAEIGSAPALFALAETYDPVILAAWGTYGTHGDAARARALYAQAHAGGVQEAKDRMEALRQ